MKNAALTLLCLALTVCFSRPLRAQQSDIDLATGEGARRQALKIELDRKLAEAQAAEKKGAFLEAAQGYTECVDLTKKIGPGIDTQQKQALEGFTATRLQLADQAHRAGDYQGADDQYARILREDPKNEQVIQLRRANKEDLAAQEGLRPSQAALDKVPEAYTNRVNAMTLVQDGRLYYEWGRLEEAEAKLNQALKLDPSNRNATYYIQLVKEQRFKNANAAAENSRREQLLSLERAWEPAIKRDLPVPNPWARTNLVHTGRGRQIIHQKLETIRIDELSLDSIPLNQVIDQLDKTSKLRDFEKKGLNFIINNNVDPVPVAAPTIDPATGLPAAAAAPGGDVDITATSINLKPPLRDVSLRQALDAIVKVADRPIKYSIEEYAIVFSLRAPEPVALHTRWFRIDPNTFLQGMQGVAAFSFGESQGGGGGGQGGGGGGRGGGGGGGRGGGGGGLGGGGQGQGQGQGGAEYVGVSLAGQRQGGLGGQGVAQVQPAQPGQVVIPGQGGAPGVTYVTSVSPTEQVNAIARQYFTTAGVDFTVPGKQLIFNDRLGQLMVRGTLQDLDTIDQAVQVLNMAPPQVTIEAKFAEVTQNDDKALGFDWFLGNTLMRNGSIGGQAGTAPSYGSPGSSGSAANPSGVFPGPYSGAPLNPGVLIPNPNTIPASATDNLLTSGLRNSAPALGTLTGILTDPQFRVVIRALEQRQGINVLSASKVTTLSARQTQIKTVRIQYIVTDLDLSQTAGGGGGAVGGVAAGAGGVGSTVQPLAEPFELGPVLDVVPYVSADGYTIQMTIIPTVKEFEGYDLQNAQLFSAQAQSVGGSGNNPVGNPLTQITPLPIFRLRQIVTSAIVWDGQTVVLGGLLLDQATKMKDKVPFLGDMPYVGRLFRSESTQSKKTSLVIFVTPTIIDPAGNRVHSEEDLPFAQTSIPKQPQAITQ